MKKWNNLILALVVSVGVAAPAFADTYVLTNQNDGASADVRVGDTVLVKITGNEYDGGYAWMVTQNDTEVLQQVGKPYTERRPVTSVPTLGGPQTTVWTFRAIHSGTSNLHFSLKRFTREPVSKLYHFDVTVQQ